MRIRFNSSTVQINGSFYNVKGISMPFAAFSAVAGQSVIASSVQVPRAHLQVFERHHQSG